MESVWNPVQFLNGGQSLILMILNQPLRDAMKQFIRQQWDNAALRIAVDGGLLHLRELNDKLHCYVPDIICGDFDSLTPDILNTYARMGSKVIHTPDQDASDFTKAVWICHQEILNKKLKATAIAAVIEVAGRFDHVMGNIDTLYIVKEFSSLPVYLLGSDTLTWLLEVGQHKIIIGEEFRDSHVGLIPLAEPCVNVTTTGLQWNLSESQMEFGRLISTCNRLLDSGCVTVINQTNLIWTMEIFFDS